MAFIIYLFLIFLCWGSFLNVLAYRLIKDESIVTPRSRCQHCKQMITWRDNIPVLSWLMLRGKCRHCSKPISLLYPFIELFTAITLTTLYVSVPLTYFFPYFIFVSALIVTIRSDLETMLISRFVTIYLLPIGFVCSAFDLLPISLFESFLGAGAGYLFLLILAKSFYWITGKEGLGQGDIELVALIGSFLGPMGSWVALLFGSVLGLLGALIYIITFKKAVTAKIPFGPFLSFGAIAYIFLQPYVEPLLLGM